MHNVITAASFGVNFFKGVISEDAPLKPILETVSEYSGSALLAAAALHGAYSYLKPPPCDNPTPPKIKYKREIVRDSNTLGRVHTLLFFTLPAIPFVWSNWKTLLLSANSLKDYLFFSTEHLHFTAHVAACVGMGGLIALQERRSLMKGLVLDGVINLSFGGIPLHRLLANIISKTPAKRVAQVIDNLWALKKGEIFANLALSIPQISQGDNNQNVTKTDCAQVIKFKSLECDSSPLSRLYQFVAAQFRSKEITAEAKRLCAELRNSNLCI